MGDGETDCSHRDRVALDNVLGLILILGMISSPSLLPTSTLWLWVQSDNIYICLPFSRPIDSVTEPPLSKGVKFCLAASNLDKLKGVAVSH